MPSPVRLMPVIELIGVVIPAPVTLKATRALLYGVEGVCVPVKPVRDATLEAEEGSKVVQTVEPPTRQAALAGAAPKAKAEEAAAATTKPAMDSFLVMGGRKDLIKSKGLTSSHVRLKTYFIPKRRLLYSSPAAARDCQRINTMSRPGLGLVVALLVLLGQLVQLLTGAAGGARSV